MEWISSSKQSVIESKEADITQSTGHSATTTTVITQSTCHSAITTVNSVTTQSTGHSATIDNIRGKCLMDDLVASFKRLEISKKATEFRAYIPPSWPIKQDMYVGMNTSQERYLENLYLLGRAWVRKVQHVARLTLNSPNGPTWPTEIEPTALLLFRYLEFQPAYPHWASMPDRADFADEIDFVWREAPYWLRPEHNAFIPIWEYVTGMARTWGWNWHNEARKQGAPKEVCRSEDRKPRSRCYLNKGSAAKHHHVLAQHRVPTIAQYTRTNKFYQVGDDDTACARPQSSPRCRDRCHCSDYAHTLKDLKKKHGLLSSPGVAPENEYGGIE